MRIGNGAKFTTKNHLFNIETQCSVFLIHTMFMYTVFYMSMTDIWGFHKAPAIVKVHLNFCKKVLGVNKRINNNMVYCELGRHPLYIRRKFNDF